MKLSSAQGLKQQFLPEILARFAAGSVAAARAIAFGIGAQPMGDVPDRHRSVALGVAPYKGAFRLAIRVQRPGLMHSAIVSRIIAEARGEVDLRMVGRLDKRAATPRLTTRRPIARAAVAIPWYQQNQRPLLIGASIGHADVTAGTLGAFVLCAGAVGVLSNNHVLANENAGRAGDWVLQRAKFDGGRVAERVARLRHVVRLRTSRANRVDAAVARLEAGVTHDPLRLRGLVNGRDRRLAGVADGVVETGDIVHKIGRTTGPTRGRVTAFEVGNVVVNFTAGNLRFDDQIEIEGAGDRPFSDGGDSGALIVNARMEAVGLLFAGGDTGGSNGLGLTYANPIATVLEAVGATLVA